ncbi:unnamed protein product [Parascedosporium putredinis]|uniref:Uncharacterized protein n=1 Tax=Parascedosporium putredinis TaxID=1442378 RepID=A0A9P1H7W9_9PEZI|nr:unnamed protein product [Parascedosporium putredinis]CAI8001577.1 unnamed protein product [Parascedosporium putredinis]
MQSFDVQGASKVHIAMQPLLVYKFDGATAQEEVKAPTGKAQVKEFHLALKGSHRGSKTIHEDGKKNGIDGGANGLVK